MRTSIARRLVQLALVPAALFGVLVVASPAEAAAPTNAQWQSAITYWTNAVRKSAGCAPVRHDARLANAATGHSKWMAAYRRFSHTGSGGSTFVVRVKRAGYSAPLSENIAWGYRSGKDLVTAWMRSPGHRANLLNCRAKAVGIGAAYASNGTTYFTQEFGTY
jgi:uncharacterized protein YkwD